MDDTRDYYAILWVHPSASQDTITAAFRRLARIYHPDVSPDDPYANERMADINLAYETLRDPDKRKEHDLRRAHRERYSQDEVRQEYGDHQQQAREKRQNAERERRERARNRGANGADAEPEHRPEYERISREHELRRRAHAE